jgi:hypothetical protein
MKQKILNLLEEAISSAGKFTWLELGADSLQLEFIDVQLYKPTLTMDNRLKKHSSELTISLADNTFFTIFYNDIKDINFIESREDFSYKISYEGLKFQDFEFVKKIVEDFKFYKRIIKTPDSNINVNNISNINNNYNKNLNKISNKVNNNIDLNNINNKINNNNIVINEEVDFLLAVSFEKFALVAGANHLYFFNEFESLNATDIKELSNQWWVYWVNYWKAKKTDIGYEYDPACEVFPLI